MLQLPIRAAHNVPGYRRVRGRHGILRRVRRTKISIRGLGETHLQRLPLCLG
jgi:hypothetical protein